MKNFFKSLCVVTLLAVSLLTAKADGISLVSLTGGTVSNLVSGSYVIQAITVLNTSTNVNTVRFYDSGTATTNIALVGYTSYAGYSTNFSTVWTNEAGIKITNSYSGWYTAPTTVATNATYTLPTVYAIMAPASTVTSKDVTVVTSRGLSALSTYDCQVAVTYRGNP